MLEIHTQTDERVSKDSPSEDLYIDLESSGGVVEFGIELEAAGSSS